MEILLVATELSPWVQLTDTADEVFALAKTFRQLGHDVTIVTPFDAVYEQGGLLAARRLTPLLLKDGRSVTVYDAQLSSGSKVVLLGLPPEASIRLSALSDLDAASLRTATTFALAVTAYVGQRVEQAQPFDVVHLFDWTAALVGLGVRSHVDSASSKIVLSVRDAERSGCIDRAIAEAVGCELLLHPTVAQGSQISLLRAGLAAADAVIVPSEGHAELWSNSTAANGLGPAFGGVRAATSAVPGGVDYSRVNPATNPALAARFDSEDASAKQVSKSAVLRELGLPLSPYPLVLIPGPLTPDAGGDLVIDAIGSLMELDLALCVWSHPTDSPEVVADLARRIAGRGNTVAHRVLDSEDTLHRGLAAADFAVYPIRRTQGQVRFLAAQRYGAVVVTLKSPGLQEAIVDCDLALDTGTGFMFDEPTSESLVGAVVRAHAAYHKPGFAKLRRRVMRLDCGWERPGRRLLQIYKRLVSGKSRDLSVDVAV